MVFRLSAFYFTFFVYGGAYVAYFPLYLADRGLSAAELGWVLALPPLARAFAPAAWGWIADRYAAHRAVVVFSCAVTAAAFAALPFTHQIGLLIGVMSVLSAGALPLVEAITLGSLAGEPGRYGPIRLWGSVGFIAAVLAGGAWLDFQPVATLPGALAAFMLATLVIAVGLPARLPAASAPTDTRIVRLSITPQVRALLGAGFFMAVAHGALYAFFTLYLGQKGYSATAIGMLWTLGVLAEILVFLYLPQLFRRYALSTILLASLICGVLRFLALGWAADALWVVLLAQLLHAATFGSFHAAAVAAVHRVFPSSAQATGQTIFSSVSYGAGAAAGTVLAGWGWELGGGPVAYSLSAIAAATGAFFAAKLRRAGL